jgi:hypothetical protein
MFCQSLRAQGTGAFASQAGRGMIMAFCDMPALTGALMAVISRQ